MCPLTGYLLQVYKVTEKHFCASFIPLLCFHLAFFFFFFCLYLYIYILYSMYPLKSL